MPQPPLSLELAQQVVDAVNACGGNKTKAGLMLGIPDGTLHSRLRTAKGMGIEPNDFTKPVARVVVNPAQANGSAPTVSAPSRDMTSEVRVLLNRGGDMTIRLIAERLAVSDGVVYDAVNALESAGLNIFRHGPRGDVISIEKSPIPVEHSDDLHVYPSDDAGCYRFGVVSDNHLGSKYSRLDVLHELYDLFEAEGITRVYNAGNWIDGEARFNRMDLLVHGMHAQVEYFLKNYPKRGGITTYYVAGDDHEGWYAQRELVDIGRFVELEAVAAGRTDLRYLGYMEAWITLRHVTGAENRMLVVHPGGGSSYATSYAPQKYIEALQGGEKPAIAIFGHWHKMEVLNYRGVWCLQAGTTEDQTPFMRKRRLEAHLGGMIVELRQDDRGSIIDCIPQMRRYFDRGYHNGSYDPARPLRGNDE